MKIQDPVRINMGDSRLAAAERSSTSPASFQRILNTHQKEVTQDHFQQLLQQIDQQGQVLNEKRTFTELRKYKDLVKKFMGDVSKNGVGLLQSESWDPYGGSKTLKTIKTIDRKLMDLTSQVLNQQNSSLSLLDQIGEIKGLLVNLYT